MLSSAAVASVPEIALVRERINAVLAEFLSDRTEQLTAISAELQDMANSAQRFVAGGKRLRPILAWWGWRAAGGEDQLAAVKACASLELVQACALVHDDVMDDSDTRRGLPAIHRQFSERHRVAGWRGDGENFGRTSAILLGDLYLSWADDLLYSSGLTQEQLANAKPFYDVMRTELMAGQYLDVASQASSSDSLERALLVIRYKSARYTIERPLQIGAALANAPSSLLEQLSEFGLHLGEAFQLRDDVLGVFGDPAVTGKPAGDDIREGKRTYLMAAASQNGSAEQRTIIDAALGNPTLSAEQIDHVRAAITQSGALEMTEARIEQQRHLALAVLDGIEIDSTTRSALAALTTAAIDRSS